MHRFLPAPLISLHREWEKKHLQKSRFTLMKGKGGKYLTLPGRERNKFAVFNNNTKKPPSLHSLIASNLAFTFLK